jgi:hypothetical protein
MINTSKIVRLIATLGFSRAIFVCALCLLVVHAVNFQECVIISLFGCALDSAMVQRSGGETKARQDKRQCSQRSGLVKLGKKMRASN